MSSAGAAVGRLGMARPIALALALTLLTLAATAFTALRLRDEQLEGEAQRLSAWASALADSVQRTLFDTELQMAEAERWLIDSGGADSPESFVRLASTREAHDMLMRTVSNSHATGGLFLVDAQGRRLATQRRFPSPPMDVSQREHFTAARDRVDGGVVLSGPTRNLQTGGATLFVSRRVLGPEPVFVGTLGAALPMAHFHRLFDDLERTGRLVGVVRSSGDLLLGGLASEDSLRRLLAGQVSATGTSVGAAAGWQTRLLGNGDEAHVAVMRVLPGYPLAVVLASPRAATLAAWREQTVLAGALAGGLMLAVWWVGFQAIRRARLQQASIDAEQLAGVNAALREEAGQRAAAQQALERINASLEQQVATRTAQLEQAVRAARAASEAKSRFLSHMSHELRTPLNAVIGYAQLLEHEAGAGWSAEQQRYLANIQGAGTQLLDLVSDVLDLASIESGALELRLEPVGLAPLIEDVVRTVLPMARRRGITVTQEPLADAAFVRADARRLRQVLLNLLSNAIKYNRDNGHVQVRAARLASDGGACWRVEVADTGPGLTEAQQARLYQPFNRLGAEASAIEGTGIGLVLSRHLVEGMRGRLTQRSRAGEGSTFGVELPAVAAPALSPQPTSPGAGAGAGSSAPPAPPASPEAPRPASVLYVEDNPANVDLVRSMLARRRDIRLDVATSAAEAWRRMTERRPDVLLLDMNLGDAHGTDLLQRLRAAGLLEGVRCLALSADAMPEQIAAAGTAGVDGYLTKPIPMRVLFDGIDRQLAALRDQRPASG